MGASGVTRRHTGWKEGGGGASYLHSTRLLATHPSSPRRPPAPAACVQVLLIKSGISPLVFTPWVLVPAGVLGGLLVALFLDASQGSSSSGGASAARGKRLSGEGSNDEEEGPVAAAVDSGAPQASATGLSARHRRIAHGRAVAVGSAMASSLSSSKQPAGGDDDSEDPLLLSKRPARFPWCAPAHYTVFGVPRQSYGNAMASRAAARTTLDVHVSVSTEGAASLRAFGAMGRAAAAHRRLLDEYDDAAAAAFRVVWRRDFFALVLASTYFVACAVLVLMLRLVRLEDEQRHFASHYGTGIKAHEAGFILLSGCAVAAYAIICLRHLEDLRALARTRGSLLWAQRTIPQDASARDSAAAAERTASFDDEYAAAVASMTAAPPAAAAGDAAAAPAASMELGLVRAREPPPEWPTAGHLSIRGLQMRYYARGGSSGSALVLRGVDIDVRPGEWVSVVGRTGAGKSSVLAALLRLVEPCGGSVVIDGVNVAEVPLRTLRHRVAVISQVRGRRGPVEAGGLRTLPLRHRHALRRTPSSSRARCGRTSTRSQSTPTGRCLRRCGASGGSTKAAGVAEAARPRQPPGPPPRQQMHRLLMTTALPCRSCRPQAPPPQSPRALCAWMRAPSPTPSPTAAPTSLRGSSSSLPSRARSSLRRASCCSTRLTRPSAQRPPRRCTASCAAPSRTAPCCR